MVLTDVERDDAVGITSELFCPLGVETLEHALGPSGGFELALLEAFCPLVVEDLELAVEHTRGVELALLELPPGRVLDSA